jgi:hypothetical protein
VSKIIRATPGLVLLVLSTGFCQSGVWYLTRGYNRADDAWGVGVDSQGYVYWATTEWLPDSSYNDIFIYKIDSAGQELWKSQRLGGQFNEVAFIVKVKEPAVYVGGRINVSGASGNSDLLVVACEQSGDTLTRNWLYSWDLAGFYEEVDGLWVRDSAIYVSGWASPTRLDQDIVIQKLDVNGRRLWSRVWAGTGIEGANGHLAADEQTLYIGSHYGPLNRGDGLLIAFDQDSGNYRWSETWGRPDSDDAIYGLEMSADSFLYAVGPSPMGLGIYSDINLIKFTRTGTKLWERRWGGPRHESGRAIAIDGDSVIYIAGSTSSYGAGQGDIFVLKYNSAGTLLDYQVWGGAGDDLVYDLALAGDYLYLTGSTSSFGAEDIDALLVKVEKRTLAFPDTLLGAGEEISRGEQVCRLSVASPVFRRAPVFFSIPKPALVELTLFDLQGRKMLTLINRQLAAGSYKVELAPATLNTGVYFIRLKAGQIARYRKIVVQRQY